MSGGCEYAECSDSALFTCLCDRSLLCSSHLVRHVQLRPELPHVPVPGLYKACSDLDSYQLTKEVEKYQLPALENSLHERERLQIAKESYFKDLEITQSKAKVMLREYLIGVKDRFLHCSAAVELEISIKRESIRNHVQEVGWHEADQLFVCKSQQDLDQVRRAFESTLKFRLSQPHGESAFRAYLQEHKGDVSEQMADYLVRMDQGEEIQALALSMSNSEWFGHLSFLFEHLSSLKSLHLYQCEDIGTGVEVLEKWLPNYQSTLVDVHFTGLGLTPELFGPLTAPLASLTQLQQLSLKGNRLRDEGMIPVASLLSTLPGLQVLDLSSNIISYVGAQALAEALPKSLISLDISLNKVGNQGLEYLAQGFGRLVCLETLAMEDCGLKASADEYWTGFGKLWSLKSLNLSCNIVPFTRLLPVLASLAHLATLKLATADLNPTDIRIFAENFHSFQSLSHLNLSKAVIGNDGSSALALYFPKLQSLTQLNLSNCLFDKEGIIRLATVVHLLEGLEELRMPGTGVGREGALHLSCELRYLANMRVLDLADCLLNEDGGEAIMRVLKHLGKLEVLVLRDNPQMGDRPALELGKSLAYLTNLRTLDLWNCGFQPEGMCGLAPGFIHLANIETLILGQNEVGLAGMKALNFPLSHLSTLRTLNLVGCMLGSQGALHLSLSLLHLTPLKELYLTANNLGNEGVGHIANSFCFLTSLQKLSISENHFGRDALFKLCRAMAPMTSLREFCLFSSEFGVKMPRSVLTSIASRISMSYVELQDYNVDDLQRELQAALPMVETIT